MIGMQYDLQGKGVSEVAGSDLVSSAEAKWGKEGICVSNEPISVLDTRRSPSPSTSTSTLSSSLGGGGTGGGGSTDNTVNLAAVSGDKPQQTWPVLLPLENALPAVTEPAAVGCRKDEWVSELQPIPAGLEVAGGERFGIGLDDWESLLSESGPEQSLFRWISGDVDDASFGFKQLLQGTNLSEIDGNAALGGVNSAVGVAIAGGSSTNATAPGLTSGVSASSSNDDKEKFGSDTRNSSSGTGHSKSANGGSSNNTLNPLLPTIGSSLNNPLPSGVISLQQQFETPEDKPQILNPLVLSNQPLPQVAQNQNLFPPLMYAQQNPLRLLQPPLKRQNLGILDHRSQIPKLPFVDLAPEFLLRKQQYHSRLGLAQQEQILPSHLQRPLMAPKLEADGHGGEQIAAQHHQQQQQQKQVVYDQLCKAAELILAGNFSHAQGILARLNHQLSPVAKPFQKAAFFFKEALQSPLVPNPVGPLPQRSPTPMDGMFKMGAYKLFSEVSPIVHFMNFTSNQAILEAIGDAERLHVVDFDVGFGAQWASFMQELPGRNRGTTSLKITAFASPSTHHPIELCLMHENLTQFANEVGINFELEIVNIDGFDPSSHTVVPLRSPEEAIAVNFPIWACSNRPSLLPPLLRLVKQLSPRIVVSLERGCERADLPFSRHLLQALQYHETLFGSLDAANVTTETMNKIERFLIQPKIESIVLGRLQASDHLHHHWRALFASAGFSPLAFSNFTETQADCVIKRSQVRGFHVEKRQGSLGLYWQRGELLLASAWRC